MTSQAIAQALRALSPPELGGLWCTLHNQALMGALVPVENELIRRAHVLVAAYKGGPGSGNWGHTSLRRVGKGPGGSDPGGGMIHNPLGYLATYRRALREGSEIRQKLAAELIERNESLNADNVDQLLGVMEMDKEKFVYYGERYGLAEAGNLEDMATAFFKDEKERDRAWWRKREELEDRAVMPHPEGAQYRIWTANITESLTEKAHAKRLGGDLDEAISLFQEKTGLMIQIGAQYDRDAAHKELSWLANMMDASPDLDACYRKAFKSIRFHNTQSGTAAMQVGGSQVSVYPTLHTANMWYHEAGHGLQTLAEQGGKLSFEQDLKPHFGQGPMPSRYALGNYSEDFAECWVHLGGGHAEALEAWAPRKAAIVRRAMEVLR